MKIQGVEFGEITIEGQTYDHDVVISLSGKVKKRKKKLSKEVYGTSHVLSLPEAEHLYEEGCRKLVVGSGMYGRLGLSEEAEAFFRERHVEVTVEPTPEAVTLFNREKGKKIGLFHITC